MNGRTTGVKVAALAAAVLVAACGDGDSARHGGAGGSYAGIGSREIAALSPERVADLLAGEGAGYALAAELNQYPGPRHVLELAEELRLSVDQHRRILQVRAQMREDAVHLGRRLVGLERELDDSFGSGAITPGGIAELTAAISHVEGRLRAVHLVAHVATRSVLTEEQISMYDRLRGYDEEDRHPGHGS